MDLKQRADLVRAIRCEIKDDMVRMVARQWQERYIDRPTRRLRRRIDEGVAAVDRFASEQIDRYQARDDANRRARHRAREADRRENGITGIRPSFRAASQRAYRREYEAQVRARTTGVGISSRWRGATGELARRRQEQGYQSPQAARDAAILRDRERTRPTRAPVIEQDPLSYQPTPRRPQDRGTMVIRERRRTITTPTRTDRPPRRN